MLNLEEINKFSHLTELVINFVSLFFRKGQKVYN